jgi:putative protease
MPSPSLSLPLIAAPSPAGDIAPSEWQGWTAADAPEPLLPQGEYAGSIGEEPDDVPRPGTAEACNPVELLAPAGGPEAAFAAFHYGADAIYLGLQKFSARAEAENFTLDQVAEVTAYAHSLTPRRRVFVTVNTLVRQDELAELIADLGALAGIGVDALIIQDLGVYRLVRRYFPELELHASTQLAVHNRAGALVLGQLGFRRVVLARELTFEEVSDITSTSGIETEVFIHGALCYSYSGLCLFSSQTLGRSGNRGKCAYSCRDAFEVTGAPQTLLDGHDTKRNPARGFPFSMKDLALPDHLPALRSAGVSCFKVEGRKKSPLYVATTTDYYRKLLDGTLSTGERAIEEADLQTVFSRPWTRLFVQSHKDKEVADRDTVGHRGTLIGHVEALVGSGTRHPRIRFHTQRGLERHDGLQIDLPILGKPFGFAVDRLLEHGPRGRAQDTIVAPAGALVEVELPADHPDIPAGAPVYCSSSQDVKRRYRYQRPKPGLFRVRRDVAIDVKVTETELVVTGRIIPQAIEARRALAGPFPPAKEPAAMEATVNETFGKLGDTHLALAGLEFHNPSQRFIPVSKLNQVRRELVAELEQAVNTAQNARVAAVLAEVCRFPEPRKTDALRWSIKVDRIDFVERFEADDWTGVDELIVDVARDHPAHLSERLDHFGRLLGHDRIRLALPALTRKWENKAIVHKIDKLCSEGWTKWEAANLSAWHYLAKRRLDLAADWSIYAVNRAAAQQLLDMGVSRFALSPEDGLRNMRSLLAEFGAQASVIVYQDTPLFLAESCAYANLIGGCPGKANCKFESMEMVSTHGERVTALDYHCRTIVLNQGPFCLSTRLRDLARAGAVALRADFIYRRYEPEEVKATWRTIRAGRPVRGGHAANFDRGME